MDLLLIIVPILLVVAVVILTTRRPKGGAGLFGLGKPKKPKTDHRTRQDRAVWAWTRVISSQVGPVNAVKMARVTMELEVHLPGSDPYAATTTWLVDEEALGYIAAGKEVPAKIDPGEPQYIYPHGSWAKFAE
jgi:hypothetical protein